MFRNRKIIFYLIIFVIPFILTFMFITTDKSSFASDLISNITRKGKILNFSNLVSPKEIIYKMLNKNVEKTSLTAFKSMYDEFDYEKSTSEYVVDPTPEENKTDPLVYLYNTHQTEEYDKNSLFDYSVKPNVMIASYILREKLNNLGVNTIVETNNMKDFLVKNNYKYNMSYHASEYFARLKTTEFPSIRYLIDIHRDSMGKNGTLLVTNDKSYARVLFVVGLEHTKSENNVGFAEKLNSVMESMYPGLSRGVSYKTGAPIHGVYNANLEGKSVLLEIGGVENKIEEVNNTMEALSNVIHEVIRSDIDA